MRDFHPVAAIFPLLSDDKLAELAEDIREHGLREAIVLHDDQIVDGRNRYLACQRAGIEPRFREWNGVGSPVSFVVSLNLRRRHLDESQRALVAARIATLEHGSNQHASVEAPSQSEAGALLNVGRASVQRARTVIDHGDPELVAAVEKGAVSVSAAAKEIRAARPAPAKTKRKKNWRILAHRFLPKKDWPSLQSLLTEAADRMSHRWAFYSLDLLQLKEIPGADAEIADIKMAFSNAAENASARLRALAATAPTTPIPWPPKPNDVQEGVERA